jgi:hypothetical protein
MSGSNSNSENPRKILLTPEYATQLLEHNNLNRPLNEQHVKRIASQILAGKWKFNGDTIKLSCKRDVLDGQHRLWAVIEAKVPIETIIVEGIEADAFATIDTLRKPRSGADVLALKGATRYRGQISTALQWLLRYQRGILESYMAPANRIENSDIEVMYESNPGIERAIERVMPLRGLVNPSVIGFFYYVLANRSPELAERMLHVLENPAGVSMNDPFFRLRLYLTSDHLKRKDATVSIAMMIKATNAAYFNREVRSLQWRNQGQNPEAFPKLEVASTLTAT